LPQSIGLGQKKTVDNVKTAIYIARPLRFDPPLKTLGERAA
jgi:hypothetical protein